MNNIYTYLNYNWVKIIKNNIKNKEKIEIKKEEKTKLSNLILKKQVCGIIFVILNFLISLQASKSVYKTNAMMHAFKDNIKITIIWFVAFTILPLLTSIMITQKLKTKKYLLLEIIYKLSNIIIIFMSIYFITEFINNVILGILGLMNIILTLIININIMVKIKENYLKETV